ncbi:hypothetical protein J2W21_000836 [Sinomonas atrocyanea]|uniref:rhamnosyltransferase WsaF family glycosyltransferase n=1 Tax=Sinomonas atrocyanea TaxID=37927 RepID=UPI00277F5554|nr:glycosyltransferase family 1 protein [Sinomonas atrocyanea]MDP9883346.1 hypothetical protein [Sinomonas atrocyanea]
MVAAAEKANHFCKLYLYDKNSDDVSRHEALIRKWWPDLGAPIGSASVDSFGDVDVLVASSWVSAHVIGSRSTTESRRFYFIQDYEPYFYPRGSLYQLAESTYHFGFVNISLGEMVAEAMKHELGKSPEFVVPFGCDTGAYRYIPREELGASRRGVAFYAKKNVPRRGYELGKLALEEFHRRHPDQPIHVFGEKVSGWRVPIINHGTIVPAELNLLYNSVIAGLTLSFTNVTLTAAEMMAAGAVPVMNEFAGSKQVLGEEVGIWSQPTPEALASALSGAVEAPDTEGRALKLASRAWRGWDETSRATIRAIEDAVRSPSRALA